MGTYIFEIFRGKTYMKKIFSLVLALALTFCVLSGCKKSELDKSKPVTLTMWHVYGEQADSPMNRLVEEFNQTIGMKKGIIINVTGMSNASNIGKKLLAAQAGKPDAGQMPDLFFGHKSNAVEIGIDNLVDWNEMFTQKELADYIPEFVSDGEQDGKLCVFPVAKSTFLLFVSGSQFEKFSAAVGVTYDSLSDWDGFFDAAAKYFEWSGGKPFCSFDYPMRNIELCTMSQGSNNYISGDWYNFDDKGFEDSFMMFADAFAKGYIVISDLYSNTQVMTGEVPCGLGSSAAILYYNDTVTYADGTSEPMNLKVLPMPQPKDKPKFITQAGVGLCAYKTSTQKAEAAAVFAKWLTDSDRNLDFAAETGYMPVTSDAFEKINDYDFKDDNYSELYAAYKSSVNDSTAVSEGLNPEHYNRLNKFYAYLREAQKDGTLPNNDPQMLWDALKSN